MKYVIGFITQTHGRCHLIISPFDKLFVIFHAKVVYKHALIKKLSLGLLYISPVYSHEALAHILSIISLFSWPSDRQSLSVCLSVSLSLCLSVNLSLSPKHTQNMISSIRVCFNSSSYLCQRKGCHHFFPFRATAVRQLAPLDDDF